MAALGLIAVLLVIGWIGVREATTQRYVQLYDTLDLAASGSVKDLLTKAGIPNKLDALGQVTVPEGELARARVAIAQEGLPLDGRPGLELFDRQTWGMTDFTQRVTYRRALEGELARTIGTLRGVHKAQVSLTLPEASPLRRLDRSATASVVVSMQGGIQLTADQVRGIAQIVSSSVEQLPLENVSVIDDSGRPLTGIAGSETPGALTSRQQELQQSVERRLADKAESMVTTALGPGTSRVQVAAVLNFDQVEQTSEVYDSAGGVLQNEQRSSGDDSEAGAGPTIINNTYLNSRKVDRIINEVGNIRRLTVAVMVDSAMLGSTTAAYEQRRNQLDTLVRNAVGADPERGDQVSVIAVAFEKPVLTPQDTTPIKASTVELVQTWGLPGVGLLAVIAALVVAFLVLRPRPVVGTALSQENPGSVTPGAAVPSTVASASAVPLATAPPGSPAPPEMAARAIRAWLADS